MRVDAISPRLHVAARRDDPPAPAPPSPDIDFTSIDTPLKAALTPALIASTFLLLYNTTAIAITSGVSSFTSSLDMTFGKATPAALTHTDQTPPGGTLNGTGTLGTGTMRETWAFNDDGLAIDGTIGANQEHLTVAVKDDGFHIDGTIGSMDIHQLITVTGSDLNEKITWDGTVGDQKLHQVRTYVDDGRGLVSEHVDGTLGNDPIRYVERWTKDEGDEIGFATQGQIGGVPIQFTHNFKFVFPS